MSDTETFYSCDIAPYGIFRLRIRSQSGVTNASAALLDVLLLHELESLTQSLETIIRQPFDWQRDSTFSDRPYRDSLALELEFDQSGMIALATLKLPVHILPELTSEQLVMPEGLKRMKWQPVSCTLCLSTLKLSGKEQDNLGGGALVIIPESFAATWNATLKVGHSLQLQGQYLIVDDNWLVSEPVDTVVEQPGTLNQVNDSEFTAFESQGRSSGSSFRVVFACELDPVDLMRSSNPVSIGISGQQHDAALSLLNGDGTRYQGSLLPLATGYALLLDLVDTSVA